MTIIRHVELIAAKQLLKIDLIYKAQIISIKEK